MGKYNKSAVSLLLYSPIPEIGKVIVTNTPDSLNLEEYIRRSSLKILWENIYRVSNSKVISDAIIDKIQHAGIDSQRFDKGAFGKRMIHELGERPSHNAYQWDFVMEDGDCFKAGLNGQGLYISPKKDLVIACFSHGDYMPGVSVAYLSRAIAKSFDKKSYKP